MRFEERSFVEKTPTIKNIRHTLIPGAAIALFLIMCLLHFSGLFSLDTRSMVSLFLDLPLRALLLLALADGIGKLRTPCERRFWALTLAAFSAWFIADMAFQPEGTRPLILGLLEDGAFLLFYPLLMVAIEQRPCRYHWPITGWGSRMLCAAAGVILILWTYFYFVVLTLFFAPDAFLSEAPSYAFFATADFIFGVAFLIRMLLIRDRWRVIYGLFGSALLVWGFTDTLDALGRIGIEVIPIGTPLDILWTLPYFAIIAAAVYRNRSSEKGGSIPTTTTQSGTLIISSYAYAFAVPVIHLVVFLTGLLREIEIPRELTVLAGLAILFPIAMAIQARERRRRQLTREPRIIVVEDEQQHVQKMEALGRLAGGIAHDFNNLLMVLQSQIDTRADQLLALPDGREFVGELQTVVRRGSDLSHQLLAFGRKQVSRVQVLNPGEVVRETESLLRRTLGEHIELEISIADDLWPVAIDPGQLSQVLINLTLNGRTAMPEGGRLEIRIENVAIDYGDFDLVEGEQFVQIEIVDNGHGMDERTRTRVFEPFFSKRTSISGTGLGMAVVYGIVKQHDGHITCESSEGSGTTFRVHLPRCEASESVEPEIPTGNTPDPGGTETILIAEDEPEVRTVVSEYLRTMGYQVIEATDGAEALKTAESFDGTIHLLLTDVVMPKIGGPELADRMTATRPAMPVLFVTGYADDLPLQGRKLARTHVLQKPYSLVTLGTTIRMILDRD
jgi:signal transduction histidine kinase